jgi:diguanylate cyclase (GGDEF)-like protein/PAS domain S-box-containing protein
MTGMKKVLVVDDDATISMLMEAALRKSGFDVVLADGGLEGLRLFRLERPDVVMLDVDMPDMNGNEVCTVLRAEAGELLPIVMVTGKDDLLSVERAYDSGATDFIAKPIHLELIGHRVRYLLRGYQALLDLQQADDRNAAVLNAIPDLLFELDLEGNYIAWNVPRSDLLAAPIEQFAGRSVREILPPDAAQVCLAALRAAHRDGSSTGLQYELPLPSGRHWFELSVSRKVTPSGQMPHFIVLARDVTERKEAETRIARLAFMDSLTGLPNRPSFLERVDREIRRAEQSHRQLAVLFMDLDGFKNVNDTMGHSVGDKILQMAAERLREGLRPADVVSRSDTLAGQVELARLGGDEFTALMVDIYRPDDALAVAQRIVQMMRSPFQLDTRAITLTASVGIALYPQDGLDAATLLQHADTAMYHAKSSGRDNAQLYSVSLTEQVMQRMELDTLLRVALERGEFHLEYQPQFDVTTGRCPSVEALIRWTHPIRGVVSPLDFIPLAEQNGLIDRIGHWVLETACIDAARWHRQGIAVRVAVNLSPVQFRDPALLGAVLDVLRRTDLPPAQLELEVTESVLLENSASALATLRALRDHGMQVALDDFGTGYSSLSYLTRMPIGNLKVDRAFIRGLMDGGQNAAIVRAILAMAKSLNMHVTAEGVETLDQALALRDMGCDSLQGYYFSRPQVAAKIPGLMQQVWDLTQLAADAVPLPPAAAPPAGGLLPGSPP